MSNVSNTKVHDTFMKEAIKNGGKLIHDYSNDVHYEYVLEILGGKELLQLKFPRIYEALERTRNKTIQDKLEIKNISQNNEIHDDMHDGAEIVYIKYDKAPTSASNKEAINTNPPVETSMKVQCIKNKSIILIMGELTDKTTGKSYPFNKQKKDTKYYNYINQIDLQDHIMPKDKVFNTTADFIWPEDKMDSTGKPIMHSETQISEDIKVIGGDSMVKEVIVTDPMPKNSKGNFTDVLYAREPKKDKSGKIIEICDYTFPNVMKDNMVKVNMPFKGSIEFEPDYEIIALNKNKGFKLDLEFLDDGVVTYSNQLPEFKISEDGSKITWEFNDDWKANLDTSHFRASVLLDFYCSMYITIVMRNTGREIDLKVAITSTLKSSSDTSTKIIPQINIRWGCIGKGVKIKLFDGSEKNIEELQRGDNILSDKKEKIAIRGIITGFEKDMIYMETYGGKNILVTRSHPVFTEKGIKRADKVTAADNIYTIDGFEKILYCYEQEYNDKVYNLDFGSENAFFGNGLLLGDLDIQSKIEKSPDEKASETYSKETLLLSDELEQLSNILKGGNSKNEFNS